MARISDSTISRLSIYLRQLENVSDEGSATVSSSELAERSAVKATQLRKDLSHFGSFGVRGLGYDVTELTKTIRSILGLDERWNAVLFGAGSLGRALAGYKGFERHNIRIVAIIDSDPNKIGTSIEGVEIRDASQISAIRQETGARIAVLAVPAEEAQKLAEKIQDVGFQGIVNFAPVRLKVSDKVLLHSVDLAIAFEHLTYKLIETIKK